MKIAYLVHSDREYDELVETINQLIKQQDHVFIMINDNDLRGRIHFVYAEDRRVHISEIQEFAQEGDLSMARGTMLQMKEAVELGGFDYFINLSDGMIPIKPRSEIIAFLEAHNGKDFYYIDRDETQDPSLRKKALKYYTFTNLLAFPKSTFAREFTKLNANFFNMIGLRRKLDDAFVIGSPWFMICKKSALLLVDHVDYISTNFKLSWYPEEMYIPMMMKKFVNMDKDSENHINNDYRYVGPNGHWVESQSTRAIDADANLHLCDALFAGSITTAPETLHFYEEFFDKYNEGYVKSAEQIEKEERIIDPDIFLKKK